MAPIFLINLDRDTDRLRLMDEQFARLGLAYERFSAVRGDALGAAARWFHLVDGVSPTLTSGEVGCYASHLTVMEMLIERGAPAALVCEDDCRLSEHLPRLLAEVDALPESWELVRLATLPVKQAVVRAARIGGGELVKYSRIPVGAGAYLISRRGAEKYLAWAAKAPLVHPYDEDLARPWICGLSTYGFAPTPIRQNVLPASSIGDRPWRPRNRHRLEPLERAVDALADLGLGGWLVAAASNVRARLSRAHRRRITARVGA
ncbi:glycosyltransferase family 25 protein [Caulobacter sp. 17J80-11]|uniref:glycosyltransferase family 25 protein n=1 Tax=Caulobacter sp. 17J80-11 TaxID=2763502 RepID=UPI001653C8FD|nr:glycosyltransferase family 25 protein [Caulobacter sp. 17J80-11]MBC6981838.1 glycosyltransferase family 25 protein [Caulobacter sp. 17J80-11]